MTGSDDLGPHGQPLNRFFNSRRLADRTVDELMGICKGLISDGEITAEEARFLIGWIDRQRDIVSVWPINGSC